MRNRTMRVGGTVAATAAAVLAAVVALAGCSAAATPGPAPAPTATAAPTVNPFSAGSLQDPSAPPAVADAGAPTAVRIPSIGVTTPLESLRVGAAGELEAPVAWEHAGWFADGPAPGEIGPAIIAGHVDSPTGPAVFYRLQELKTGDEIVVDTESGRSLTFVVTTRVQSAKATFPTSEVYGTVPRPELRLITCAGFFDRSVGHYTDNLIVFASLRA